MTLENIVYACYEEHKKHTSNWQHGKPQKAYYLRFRRFKNLL